MIQALDYKVESRKYDGHQCSGVSGPAEHRGTADIRPHHLLALTFFITLFQPGGAEFAHLIGMSLPTFVWSVFC